MNRTSLLIFLLLPIWSYAQSSEHATYHLGALTRLDTTQPLIRLVFTGHEYSDGGQAILRTLKKQNVPAHFFFTGDFYRNPDHRQLIRKLQKYGHYLGAHSDKHLLYASWTDRDSLLVTKKEFTQDLLDNYKSMAAFGISRGDSPYFLPPYEWYNQQISNWTKELGFQLINFTPGTRSNADYTTPDMGKRYISSQEIYDSILDYEKSSPNGLNGFILLLHIGTHPARTDKFYNLLPMLIKELKGRGYEFGELKL